MALQYKVKKQYVHVMDKEAYLNRAVRNDTVDLEGLAQHMSQHHTPYSAGTIFGILTDMVDCMYEYMTNGHAVKIDNLGIFGLAISCKAVTNKEDATLANIKRVKMRCRTTGKMATVCDEVEIKLADDYTQLANIADTTTDTTNP